VSSAEACWISALLRRCWIACSPSSTCSTSCSRTIRCRLPLRRCPPLLYVLGVAYG
jgi:hypothetical protein